MNHDTSMALRSLGITALGLMITAGLSLLDSFTTQVLPTLDSKTIGGAIMLAVITEVVEQVRIVAKKEQAVLIVKE